MGSIDENMIKFNEEKIYIVLNEGDIVYASYDREDAEGYALTKNICGAEETLSGWGNDDPTDDDWDEASFQNGFDGGYHEVVEVDSNSQNEDGEFELDDGTTISAMEVYSLLNPIDEEF